MQYFLSSGVNFPCFLGFPWNTLISVFGLSSNALMPGRHGLDLGGPANMCQFLFRSLVAFTNIVMVSGCRDIWMIFWWSNWFKFFLKAYIWVCSSTLACLACILQSWYHSLNSLFPIGSVTFWTYPYFFSYCPVYLHAFLRYLWYLGLHHCSLWLPWCCPRPSPWHSSPCCSWTCDYAFPYAFLALYLSSLYWVLPSTNWWRSHRALAHFPRPFYSRPHLRTLDLLLRTCLPYSLPLWR